MSARSSAARSGARPQARTEHRAEALAAAWIGGAAAFAASAVGAIAFALLTITLVLGWGRGRGWSISRALERQRLWSILHGVYLPAFVLDLVLTAGGGPIHALGRLIVFLLAGESLAGDRSREHRPVLFGLLLLMSGASETTDIWFALPLAAFSIAAVTAQMRSTLIREQPAGSPDAAPRSLRAAAALTLGSLVLGTALFFVIPRFGAGWGRKAGSAEESARIETGLSEEVSLGVLGRVKRRTTVAFRARPDPAYTSAASDPDEIYWRAHCYARWTGSGWTQQGGEAAVVIALPAGEAVAVPPAEVDAPPTIVMQIERVRVGPTTLPSPGRPIWLRSTRNAYVSAAADGTIRGVSGATPRSYEVAAHLARPRNGPRPAADSGGEHERESGTEPVSALGGAAKDGSSGAADIDPSLTETGGVDPEVREWAESVAPGASSPLDLARAFVADLASRPYSLDTTTIDPRRPIASFLAGAPAHCEYFASAMALGLRLRGVPARTVGGYLGADRVLLGRDLIVRDSRAHLWVEALIPGSGWLTFDPTPAGGRFLSAGGWPELRAVWDQTVLVWDSWIIGLDLGDQIGSYLRLKDGAVLWAAGLARGARRLALPIAAVVALAGLAAAGRKRRARSARLAGIPRIYRRLLAMAAKRRITPERTETAVEFARRAGAALGSPDAVGFVSRLYERERFGGAPASVSELTRAESVLRSLARA